VFPRYAFRFFFICVNLCSSVDSYFLSSVVNLAQGELMSIPTNTFTVAIADAHSHTVSQSAVPANNKLDAALNVLQTAVDNPTAAATYGTLVTTDTWTITITQP
jgi:hypothetical protein